MRRKISSKATQLHKAIYFLTFGCFITFSAFSTINIFRTPSETDGFQILIGIAGTLFSILFVKIALSWKDVEIDDAGLIVTEANFFVKKTSTLVPFENIKSVQQSFFLRGNPDTVTVEFVEPTFFGTKIRFVPTFRFSSYSAHPIVDELNYLLSQKNSFLN